jgi:hypothetical protein
MPAATVITPEDLGWITRPHAPGEPAHHVIEDLVIFAYGYPPDEGAELLPAAV